VQVSISIENRNFNLYIIEMEQQSNTCFATLAYTVGIRTSGAIYIAIKLTNDSPSYQEFIVRYIFVILLTKM